MSAAVAASVAAGLRPRRRPRSFRAAVTGARSIQATVRRSGAGTARPTRRSGPVACHSVEPTTNRTSRRRRVSSPVAWVNSRDTRSRSCCAASELRRGLGSVPPLTQPGAVAQSLRASSVLA